MRPVISRPMAGERIACAALAVVALGERSLSADADGASRAAAAAMFGAALDLMVACNPLQRPDIRRLVLHARLDDAARRAGRMLRHVDLRLLGELLAVAGTGAA